MFKGKRLGDRVQGKTHQNGDKEMGTFVMFTDGITVVAKSSNELEFIVKASSVFERFDIEVYEEDVFEYDPDQEGGWGDEDMSLNDFLDSRGIEFNGRGVVVIIEDPVEGIEVEVVG